MVGATHGGDSFGAERGSRCVLNGCLGHGGVIEKCSAGGEVPTKTSSRVGSYSVISRSRVNINEAAGCSRASMVAAPSLPIEGVFNLLTSVRVHVVLSSPAPSLSLALSFLSRVWHFNQCATHRNASPNLYLSLSTAACFYPLSPNRLFSGKCDRFDPDSVSYGRCHQGHLFIIFFLMTEAVSL